ncbi:MAG: hypothetical protein QM820_10575 [Minicystis sp.]
MDELSGSFTSSIATVTSPFATAACAPWRIAPRRRVGSSSERVVKSQTRST